jgi:hypothetical protein
MSRLPSRSFWVLGALATVGSLPIACKGSDAPDDASQGGAPSGGKGSGGAATSSGGQGGAPADTCVAPAGPGTEVPSAISDDQTWTHEGSPYIVRSNVIVTGHLTLEKCTVVRLAEDVSLTVRGSIVGRGEAVDHGGGDIEAEPVAFGPLEEGKAWGSLDIESAGSLDLEVAAIVGGGAREATIHAWGDDQYGLPHRNVRLLGAYISNSAGPAVFLETRAGFSTDSTDVVIETSGSADVPYPIVIEAGAVESLPSALTLADNPNDEIYVVPFRPVNQDTFKDLGYPYVIDGRLVVAHANGVTTDEVSTLTIEPGVTLRMLDNAGSGLFVGNGAGIFGRLIAEGTADKPIRFESGLEDQQPADWLGLYFAEPVSSGNSLKYVQVAHAGAQSGAQSYGCGPIENDASILILNSMPVDPFLENCTIESAGGDTQILLGWDYDGDPDGSANAILQANSFDAAGPACQVSLPQNAESQCPGLDDQPDCL